MKFIQSTFGILLLTFTTLSCSGIGDGLQHSGAGDVDETVFYYTISIEDNADVTYLRDVEININPGDALEMRFSNNSVDWSSWENVATGKDWILQEISSQKTVYAEFRKFDGTIVPATDEIEFIEKILPLTENANDLFGTSVAASDDGNVVIVGGENSSYTNSFDFTYRPGVATVYRYDGVRWISYELSLNGATVGDKFGASVAINGTGDFAAVGSPGFDSNRGRVLLFAYDGGSDTWEFVSSRQGEVNSCFGNSIALSGDGNLLIAGAVAGNDRKGEAILYDVDLSGFTESERFSAADGLEDDGFGCSVAINENGTVVIVGADNKRSGAFTNSGSAYIYRKEAATYEMRELESDSPGYNLFFGSSLSVSEDGNVISIGAKGDYSERGIVYVFRYNSISETYSQYNVIDVGGSTGDQFGYSVALSGDGSTLTVGSPYFDDAMTDTGKICRFIFDGSVYVKADDYLSSDQSGEKLLGYSVSTGNTGTIHFSGAMGDYYRSTDCGTFYVFRD